MNRIMAIAVICFTLLSHPANSEPIRIGLTLGLTGKYSKMSQMQAKGFKLWERNVNRSGGILGREVKVSIEDDGSSPDKSYELYEQMVKNKRVDLIFGPYSSSISIRAASVAEKYRTPILISGGSSDSLWNRGFKYVFGVYTPASKYTVGFLELLAMKGIDKIAIVFADDLFSKSIAEGTKKWAKRFGLTVTSFTMFEKGKKDLVNEAKLCRKSVAQVLIVCGHFNESVSMKKALKKIKWTPRAYFASVGPVLDSYYKTLGKDGEETFSSSQWEHNKKIHGKETKSGKFFDQFMALYNEEPSYHAATAYASGEILKEAILKAGGIDRDRIRDILSSMDTTTLIGRYGVDSTGRQIRHYPTIVQWQRGKKEIVWPEQFQTAKPRFSE